MQKRQVANGIIWVSTNLVFKNFYDTLFFVVIFFFFYVKKFFKKPPLKMFLEVRTWLIGVFTMKFLVFLVKN